MITMTKRRNYPTMTKRRRSQVLLEADHQRLFQGFSILEREWNSFNSTSKAGRRGSSADSDAIVMKSLRLLNNSPRSLMSSLQAGVRSNDEAREEIRRDRRAAIESGKMKGRRLFEAEESEAEAGFGEREEISSTVTSYGNEGKGSSCERSSEEEKVCGCCVCCRSGSGLSSLSDGKEDGGGVAVAAVGGGKVVGVNVDKMKRDEISFVSGGGRWIMVMIKGWFSVVLMVFAVGVIFMRCNGGYEVEDEVMLVPT